ncbi:isocitrate lyase/PEP mutase family protein [Ornithinimicrobium avium]|uniref:Isocitrate lyase/phosphoenolpyruvate mutase family protein n=1 Tax=Ornithinimicrobium avium TaxID=2283195 RepID=A0A345NJW2_9MICO|nr:isocitrate lyase/phosphoenolpyruvate mutase family protein [Ornithinimicrobium avium]AXH95320.1 isocitrate lyase/phosphoenolpyruvate mutase family protein [Ornithinimicrobium avium]
MTTATTFLSLHRPGDPLLLPNAWDRGSVRLFAGMGFRAIATTSSGYAASRGLLDGHVGRDETLAHAADLVAATGLPVSADLEDCYAPDSDGVAETVRLAAATGLAGGSVEDWASGPGGRIYPFEEALERVVAAVGAARSAPDGFVLTARAENHIRGVDDLEDTLRRLRAYAEAGADVVYAPGLTDLDQIRRVVQEVGVPVNVLARRGGPGVAELAGAGVARISVGGSFAFAGLAAVGQAARELLEDGTVGYAEEAAAGSQLAGRYFC